MTMRCSSQPDHWSGQSVKLKWLSRVAGRGATFRIGVCGVRLIVSAVALLAANAAAAQVPDLSGVWLRDPPPHTPAGTPEELVGQDFGPPPGLPDEGFKLREPYATRYRQLQDRTGAAEASGEPLVDTSTLCRPEGVPGMMVGILPIEITQTRTKLLVIAEELSQVRRIYIGVKPPPLDEITPSYNGFSWGRWERDTLIVRTIGIREEARYLDLPHSRSMEVTERFRLTPTGLLEVRILVEDPAVLLQPYRLTFRYRREPTYRVQESLCENNKYRLGDDGKVIFDMHDKP